MRKLIIMLGVLIAVSALGGCGYRSHSSSYYGVNYGSYDCDPGYEVHHYKHGYGHGHGHGHGHHRRGHHRGRY